MNAIVTVHHPVLTPEERAFRMEELKKRTIEFMREVKHKGQSSPEIIHKKKEAKTDATA